MGEYADMILDGDSCSECGVYIGEGDGYPRPCDDCKETTKKRKVKKAKKRRGKNQHKSQNNIKGE